MLFRSDAVIAAARTNAEGRFTTRIYMPVAGEGPQDLAVVDESGNGASTSFYVEFGFGQIRELQQDLLRQLEDLRRLLERAPSPGTSAEGQGSPS